MSLDLLVVTAHPDDEVLIAGGTLAACARNGASTGVACLTQGESGPIADPALATPDTLGRVRVKELHDACAELGVTWTRCYRRADGNLRWSDRHGIMLQLARLIDRERPRIVITFGEEGLYWHQDHIAVHELTARASGRAEHEPVLLRSLWLKGEMRKLEAALEQRGIEGSLWGLDPGDFGVEDDERGGEVVVDVRAFVDAKLAALRRHRTQLEPDNLLPLLPAELVVRFFGHERFAPIASADREPDPARARAALRGLVGEARVA